MISGVLPSPYRKLLRTSGVPAFVTAALVARMPTTMVIIALSFWARDRTGTFAWSGVLVACYTAGAVLSGPWLGRLVDRRGARRVLVVCGLVWLVATAVVAVLPDPLWTLALPAAVAMGAGLPPVSPVVRSGWAHLVGADDQGTGYTLEATLQEIMFAVGPLIAASLVAFAGPRWAMVGCGVVSLGGTLWFSTRAALGRIPTGATLGTGTPGTAPHRTERVFAGRGRVGLVLGMGLLVAGFSATQLALVAFAEAAGQRLLSGALEAVWAGGSFVGGLVAGALTGGRGATAWRRVLLIVAGFTICALVPGTWPVVVGLVLSGLLTAPATAAIYERMGELAPRGARAEAFAWLGSAGLAGSGLSAALSGRVVQAYGAPAGFLLAAACTLAAAAVLVLAGRTAPARPATPTPTLASE